MKILVIGSGGREHALVWKIKQSSLVRQIFCAPGNGGIAQIAECVDIDPMDIKALLKFAKQKKIDLTVVGPEAALTEGIVDLFEKEGLKIFGPSKVAAKLEGSKVFAKEFMQECNIPTAAFKVFTDIHLAKEFINNTEFPLVIKADGLAAGKGVMICPTRKEAEIAIDQIMKEKIFKEAGNKIVIEECLQGEEVSILAICDGENYVVLESAQDHKRIFDDDLGPNTGGMGAYSPAPIVNGELLERVESRIIEPTIRGMKRNGYPFRGVLYVGLMVTVNGPIVLEYNVRFGDPEAQVIIPRLKNDLVEIMHAACDGRLDDVELQWEKKSCVCVVISSGGYPGKYDIDKEIYGLGVIKEDQNTIVFHAGTKEVKGKIFSNGGRVLGVTGLGRNIEESIDRAYKAVEKINFERCFFRRDIGMKALKRINDGKVASHR